MKVGLEIHQRLKTHKLFCSCPSDFKEGEREPDGVFIRKLHVAKSETGSVDYAALEEEKKNKTIKYYYFSDASCLVELDEEPPHDVNEEAVDIALEIASQFHSDIVDYIIPMRKIVIDGSNPSGFQRTMLISTGGFVETSKGKVRIETICLEEESAGIVREGVFRLDRLGIPLVEISTAPDIVDGAHAKEVAEKIGLILRSTGRVARGIGTIRQDLNVSIEGGARVEIKGAQELSMIPKWVEYEVKRQEKLLEIIREVKKRNAKLSFNIVDLTDVLRNVKGNFIEKAISKGAVALGMRVDKHKGILGINLSPGRRYGSEISDYAKSAGVGGIIHSDEDLSKYKFSDAIVDEIRSLLSIKDEDAFIIVIADKRKAEMALRKAFDRLSMDYIPNETRKALPNGSTSYMRPLPGKARMYPETDVKHIEVTKDMVEKAEERARHGFVEKLNKLKSLLPDDLANKMIRSRRLSLFERAVDEGVDPKVAASVIEDKWRMLSREGVNVDESIVWKALLLFKKRKISKQGIEEAIRLFSKGESRESVLSKIGLITGKDLDEIIEEENYDMKSIMKKYRLRVDAKEVMSKLRQMQKKK